MAGISGAGRRGDPSRSPERAARARAGSVRDDKVHEAGPGRGGPGPRGGPRQSQETTAAGRRGKLPPGPDRVGRGEYIVRPSLIRLRDQFPFNSNQLRARQLLRRARSLARSSSRKYASPRTTCRHRYAVLSLPHRVARHFPTASAIYVTRNYT